MPLPPPPLAFPALLFFIFLLTPPIEFAVSITLNRISCSEFTNFPCAIPQAANAFTLLSVMQFPSLFYMRLRVALHKEVLFQLSCAGRWESAYDGYGEDGEGSWGKEMNSGWLIIF